MDRPIRFEEHRWLGDKRNQIAHDVDSCDRPEVIEELLASQQYASFGPDTIAEAGNRCYRRCQQCPGARAAADAELAEALGS
ncbi:MAG TPA: hypothetical protein VHA73_16845 [Acidimicrobiales bacterium]|jgi:hypothetical protein|nr:hypothetical protein [Acidimicrobiales bacterium]